jgi:hypothetical protein
MIIINIMIVMDTEGFNYIMFVINYFRVSFILD